MTTPKNNDAIVTTLTKRINGIQKYLKAEKPEIPVNGTLLKPAAFLKLYQRNLDARSAVTAAHAAYQGALKARDESESDRLAADESLKGWVLARYGAGSTEATELGFAPRKPAQVSAATRAAAVEQGKATRTARGTMGKKQKQQIKGVVPTSTAPAAPAVTTTSAPAQTLVALPALLTSAASTTSSAPPAQVAVGASSAPPPTVAPPATAPVAASAAAAPAQEVTHS